MNERELRQLAHNCAEAGRDYLIRTQGTVPPVSLEKLHLGHVSLCILALQFGSYGKGKRVLGLHSNEQAATYGFWWHPDVQTKDVRQYYVFLTEAWVRVYSNLHELA